MKGQTACCSCAIFYVIHFSNSRRDYRVRVEFRQLLQPIVSNPALGQDNIPWESVDCRISLVPDVARTRELRHCKDFQSYRIWIARRIQPSMPLRRPIASLRADGSRRRTSSSCIIRRTCHNAVHRSCEKNK